MKINSISPVHFGYNKSLNKKLIEKLSTNPTSPVNQSLLKINEACNDTEDRMRKLEKQGIEKNQNLINILQNF